MLSAPHTCVCMRGCVLSEIRLTIVGHGGLKCHPHTKHIVCSRLDNIFAQPGCVLSEVWDAFTVRRKADLQVGLS